ncbi:MAG: 3-hydroxyacyl-CoA dehydrogenase family protein [Candidatus Bathyarchaeia archaeon]
MNVDDFGNIAVVGAGIMGHGIALVFALHGYKTSLIDIDEKIIEKAFSNIRNNIQTLLSLDVINKKQAESVLPLIKGTTKLDVIEKADFVIEAVPEKLELKKQIFRKLDEHCPQNTILASNTSTLSISAIAAATKRPDKVIGVHWMNPPYILPLVEIIRGDKTSDSTLSIAVDLMKKLKKDPVVCKDVPGFLVNRMQFAMVVEALTLLEQGIASAEDLDKVWTKHLGIRFALLGPITASDHLGLDVIFDCQSYLYEKLKASKFKPPKILEEKVKAGELGVKSGKGFHNYEKAKIEEIISARDKRMIQLLRHLKII